MKRSCPLDSVIEKGGHKRKMEPIVTSCRICGKIFETEEGNNICNECRAAGYDGKKKFKVKCIRCGRTFSTDRPRTTRICQRCKKRLARRKYEMVYDRDIYVSHKETEEDEISELLEDERED